MVREPSPNVPLLAHIHNPKTAGSSFRRVLDEYYGPAHIHLYFDNSTTFVYENNELTELVRGPSIKAFSSHFVRRFPSVLAGRPVYYVTFLRDPIQQFISYISYTRKYYAAIHEPILLSHLPPQMAALTIRESARWILDGADTSFRSFRENYTTNFFARYPLLDSHGFDYADPRYRNARVNAARRVLSRFLLVGITEYMDESWYLLRRRAAKIGIELPDVRLPVENVTADQRESLDWIHADDEVGRKLLDSVREDLTLYRWALNRFRLQYGICVLTKHLPRFMRSH